MLISFLLLDSAEQEAVSADRAYQGESIRS